MIEMFFAVCALIAGFMACCTRIGSWISSFLTLIALVFQIVTASLMTYVLHIPNYIRSRFSNHNAQLLTYPPSDIVPATYKVAISSIMMVVTQRLEDICSLSCGHRLFFCSSPAYSTASQVLHQVPVRQRMRHSARRRAIRGGSLVVAGPRRPATTSKSGKQVFLFFFSRFFFIFFSFLAR